MPDPDLYGVFREETSHTVGDPYKKKTGRPTLPRHSGKQFVTIFPQSGKLPEAFIDKNFKRLSEGDLFVDPSKTERNLQQRGGTNVSTKPFVPSNPSRKNTGPGAIDGCIGNVILSPEGEDEAKVKARNAKSDAEKRKKIYSSPAQKGGFGYPSQARTIGGNPPEYMADKYQFGRELEKTLKKQARERISKPFVSTSKGNTIFWDNPYANKPGPNRRPASRKDSGEKKIWKPSNPPRTGAPYCAISQVGRDYQPDPAPHPQYRGKVDGGPPAFKPSGGGKHRLSMWATNPYKSPARPPPNTDFTVLP